MLVGWGVGGVVADALAAPARRVVVLDAPAPGALDAEPGEAERLRSFAMYTGARRGRSHGRSARLERPDARRASSRPRSRPARCARTPRPRRSSAASRSTRARVLRDHRLTAGHTPSGTPLTVVKAADSLLPDSPALGWDRFGPVERLGSGGDHYSMLTDRAAAAHLAMLLRRWLAPAFASAV